MENGRRFQNGYIKRIGLFLFNAVSAFGALILAIVNNGNILTDGRRYRKCPRLEI